jgi:3-mercaptopyruvate sulfurtransferase SseA
MVVEVSWGAGKEYTEGHIPGAIHVNTDEIEYDEFKARATTPPDKLGRSTTPEQDQAKGLSAESTLPKNYWNLYPDHTLLPALAHMGITRNARVIVYSHDATAAARLIWTLLYAGVDDIRILDGGLAAWKDAGFPVSTPTHTRRPAPSFGADKALHPEYLAGMEDVRDVVLGKRHDAVVVDIRTRDEYEGNTAPYSYIPTKGRIKGAMWGEAGKGPWTMESYVGENGRLKEPADVAAMWKKNGITGDKAPFFYCGTAWRSSLAFLYAWMLGWEEMRNFDASWYTWSMGPEADQNPVE